MEYTFTLKYQLTEDDSDPDGLVERLGEAGCDDALVGIGQPGRLALEFTREADSADAAVRSALADVRSAVPSARLIERMERPRVYQMTLRDSMSPWTSSRTAYQSLKMRTKPAA